jgi:uncharacterized protein YciI
VAWYLTLRHDVRPRAERVSKSEQHFEWMRARHRDGTILFSGPSNDPADTGKRLGIYVIRAKNLEEATRIAKSDPHTVAGDTDCTVIEWHVHQIMGLGKFSSGWDQEDQEAH